LLTAWWHNKPKTKVPAQSFLDFEVKDDDVDIENEMLSACQVSRQLTVTKRNGSEIKKSKKKRKKYTRMPRMEPQDARVGGSAAVWEGGSAPATPTQQGRTFGAKDAATEFRTRVKVSSQMNPRACSWVGQRGGGGCRLGVDA